MKNLRKASIGLLILGALLLLAATVPQARAASVQSFTVTATFTSFGTPQKIFTDDQGVTHIRGQPGTGVISGDFRGTFTVMFNANIDAAGNGDSFGSFTISPASGGTWAGHFSGTFTAGVQSGSFVGQGSGAIQGTKIMGNFMQISPTVNTLQGTILNPHG